MKRVNKTKRVQIRRRAETIKRVRRTERGQALPLFILVMIALLAMVGLAIDAGRLYVARAELVRALDSAALAGVVELPDLDAAEQKAAAYFDDNEDLATLSFPSSQNENQFKVQGMRNVNFLFIRVLGFSDMDVKATAAAGFGTVPMDAYMALDATGSMHTGCNAGETNTGGACPIKEARDAANGFVDILLGTGTPTGLTSIGAGAFRGCYNLPRNNTKCIDATPPGSFITNLTSNAATLHNGINTIRAIGATGQPTGGSGTNICQALKKAQEVMFGAGSHTAPSTLRAIILLSDGDNVYNATEVNQNSPASPESPCRPTSPATSDGDVSANCRTNTQTQEAKVDMLSRDMATTLKFQDVEIFVVGLSPCGGSVNATTPSFGYCGGIGNGDSDSIADQRLLKCRASSTPGTNDHVYFVNTAAELPGVFETIAQTLAFRLIE